MAEVDVELSQVHGAESKDPGRRYCQCLQPSDDEVAFGLYGVRCYIRTSVKSITNSDESMRHTE